MNENHIKHNHEIYTYYIGKKGVLIKNSSGWSRLVSKLQIKGQARPNLLKRLLNMGRRNVHLKHGEVEEFIRKHY